MSIGEGIICIEADLNAQTHGAFLGLVLREEHKAWQLVVMLYDVQKESMALSPQVLCMSYFPPPKHEMFERP